MTTWYDRSLLKQVEDYAGNLEDSLFEEYKKTKTLYIVVGLLSISNVLTIIMWMLK